VNVILRVRYDVHGDEEWALHNKSQENPLVTCSEEETARAMAANEGWDIVGELVDARTSAAKPEPEPEPKPSLKPGFEEKLISTLTRNSWVVEKTMTWVDGQKKSCVFRCRRKVEKHFRDEFPEEVLDMIIELRKRGRGVDAI